MSCSGRASTATIFSPRFWISAIRAGDWLERKSGQPPTIAQPASWGWAASNFSTSVTASSGVSDVVDDRRRPRSPALRRQRPADGVARAFRLFALGLPARIATWPLPPRSDDQVARHLLAQVRVVGAEEGEALRARHVAVEGHHFDARSTAASTAETSAAAVGGREQDGVGPLAHRLADALGLLGGVLLGRREPGDLDADAVLARECRGLLLGAAAGREEDEVRLALGDERDLDRPRLRRGRRCRRRASASGSAARTTRSFLKRSS